MNEDKTFFGNDKTQKTILRIFGTQKLSERRQYLL